MLKSEPTDFNPLSAISVQLRLFCSQLIQSIAQKPMARVSLLVVLGLGGVSWLGIVAIAPQSAHAYTANVEVSLSRQSRESFQSFLRRAEAVARAAVQRSFDRDILVSYVAVTVVGQNNGAIAPVLKLNVSRKAWRNRPDPQRWTTYLPNTESLLGFNRTTGEPEIPEPTPTQNQQPTQRRQQPSPRQPPETIINIPGANIRLLPPPPQPTTLPPGSAGANPNAPGGAGTNNPNGGAGTNNPNGGAGTNNSNGGAGTNNPNGGAGTNNPNGGAGTNNPNGGAGTNNPNGGAGTNNPNGGSFNQPGGSGTNTP